MVAIGLLVHEWIGSHDAMLAAQQTAQTQELALKTAQAQITDLKQEEVVREAALQNQLDSMNRQFAQANSPQQIAALIAPLMNIRQPIQFVTPPATAENPNPQPVAQVSTADAPAVKAYVEACESCKLQLPAAQAQVKSLSDQNALLAGEVKSEAAEAAAWKKAARGTFWHRAKQDAWKIGIGAAIGYAIARH